MTSLDRPCAAMSMILARITSRYDDVYFRALASSSSRSSTDSAISYGFLLGIPATTSALGKVACRSCKHIPRIRHRIYETKHLGSGIWEQLNFAISAGQVQGIGPHPWDNSRLIAGFQDNGTLIYQGSQGWQVVETGDGSFTLFDQVDPSFAYHVLLPANRRRRKRTVRCRRLVRHRDQPQRPRRCQK